MGNLHEVSRRVSAWTRDPDAGLARKLGLSANRRSLTPLFASRYLGIIGSTKAEGCSAS